MWLSFTILAYFLFAFSSLADRYLLAGSLPHPRAYAFYTGITGIFAAFLIPFGFAIPELFWIFFALGTGVVSVLGLYAAYRAVFLSGVSRIVPMVGGFFPLFTFLFAWILFAERTTPSPSMLFSFLLFTLGTVLLSLRGSIREFRPSSSDLRNSLVVAFLFALGFVLAKMVYEQEGFVNGFIWIRWGGFLTAASFLLFSQTRKVVFEKNPAKERKVYLPFLIGKGTGVTAFLLQQYAISLARNFQLGIMSALQGVQYLFLLLFVGILAFKRPGLLKEEFHGANVVWRILGVLCVGAGFLFFAL